MKTIICLDCGLEVVRTSNRGYQRLCKPCSLLRGRKQKANYKKKNPEKTKAIKVRADKTYNLKHREELREYRRKQYLKNRDKIIAKGKEWYRANKEARRDQQRFIKYKVTREWFEQKLVEQNNCCAICRRSFDHIPYIDHDHTCCNEVRSSYRRSCGECVRGLLCRICNVMLGHVDDNTEILNNAIRYLDWYKELNMTKNHEMDIKKAEGLPMGGMKKPMKSMGNKQATAESAGSTCQESMPNMGTREQTDMPPTSGMGYPCRPTPKPEMVRDAKMDQGALKKARMLNERSENGGANPSAYPDGE